MRRNEEGHEVPETLGEYRDLCFMIEGRVGYATDAVDGMIAKAARGRDEVVVAADSQMQQLLGPLLARTAAQGVADG